MPVYTTVMSITFTFQNSDHKVHQVSLDGIPWFRGKDVALLLGYSNTKQAILTHVDDDDKRPLCEVCSSCLAVGAQRNEMNTIYINEAGVRRLVVKSQKPQASELAKQLGINEETRYLRKETEIVGFIQDVLTQLMIPFEFQKSVINYRIDLYLPRQKLAVEIDENNHADRDPCYEQAREERIRAELGCKFLRINPDAPDFKLSSCVGRIVREVVHGGRDEI
jgi:very-short-patch-repair endonuclease